MRLSPKLSGVTVAGLGAATTALVVPFFVTEEGGLVLESYRDGVGIWTNCAGHTGPDVVPGQRKTEDECIAILVKDLERHNAKVVKCQPTHMPPRVHAAVLDFALNVGPEKFCTSTMRAKAEVSDWPGVCREFPRWVMANNGKVDCRIRANNCYGTVARRERQQALCEGRTVASLGAIG